MKSDYATVLEALAETTREARRLERSLRETEGRLAIEQAKHRLTVNAICRGVNEILTSLGA